MKFYNKDGNHLQYEVAGELVPVKLKACFPYIRPKEYISVLDEQGKEIAFINSIKNLDGESKSVVDTHLRFLLSGFHITNIIDIVDEYGIRVWRVDTDKGARCFQTEISARPVLMDNDLYRLQDLDGDLYFLNRFGIISKEFERYIA
jgi:hypothetical protein